jgi:NAD-dependent dihydropyrimidine dehydrogenase PreA subunit
MTANMALASQTDLACPFHINQNTPALPPCVAVPNLYMLCPPGCIDRAHTLHRKGWFRGDNYRVGISPSLCILCSLWLAGAGLIMVAGRWV